jgi:hypothetical protein
VTGIFRQKSPANIIILLVFGVLIKLPMFMSIHVPSLTKEEGVFYKGIINLLKPAANSNPLIFPMLAFGLLFLQSLLLNQFINNQRMTNRPTWFPAMAYMLITSLLPEWNYFSAPLIVNTILLYILNALFKTYNQADVKGRVYNIGLALGIASFLFLPALTFIIWIFLALMVMRPFRLNEWMLCLVGITTPFYFYAVYLFINDSWSWNNLLPYLSVNMPSVKQSIWLAGTAFLLVVPFLAGGYYVQESLRKMLIQVRKGWSLLLLYLLAAVFIPFVNSSGTLENWVIAVIPFGAFHACMYLYSSLRIIPLLIFWLTVAFVIGYQYGGPRW